MRHPVLLDGGRDARGTHETVAEEADAIVVACPPHPDYGGTRHDPRLRAVADGLLAGGVDCLRLDYGASDEGIGERLDTERAVAWAADRFERVGLFGYSFGATIALTAATNCPALAGVAALAPSPTCPAAGTAHAAVDAADGSNTDAIAALTVLAARGCPAQVISASRDATVDSRPVVDAARELAFETVALDTDHAFTGCLETVADTASTALCGWLTR